MGARRVRAVVRACWRCRCSACTNCSCRRRCARGWARSSDRQRGGSWVGVAAMGALSALIVGPCVAPPLAAAVLYIGQTQRSGARRRGVVPAGDGHGRAADRVRRRGRARHADQRAVDDRGAARVRLRLPRPGDLDAVADPARRGDAGAVGPAGARRGDAGRSAIGRSAARRTRGARFAALRAGASSARRSCSARSRGGHDPLQPLAGVAGAAARRTWRSGASSRSPTSIANSPPRATAGKPLLLDFYADWCVSCKEMEKYTFTEPAVHAALADLRAAQGRRHRQRRRRPGADAALRASSVRRRRCSSSTARNGANCA